jgi:lysophospholipase L1-like esterase
MSLLDRRGRYDALNGRNSTVALARLKALLTPHDSVVVFAVGTNDDPAHPKVLQDNLRRARSIAGRRCLVLATLSRPPVNNHSYEGLNRVIVRFASRDSRTVTFDWRRYARTHPERMASDQVHADPAGYRARAQQAYRATRACLVK